MFYRKESNVLLLRISFQKGFEHGKNAHLQTPVPLLVLTSSYPCKFS